MPSLFIKPRVGLPRNIARGDHGAPVCQLGGDGGAPTWTTVLAQPEMDRMVCMPRAVTTVQIVRVIKKYLGDNPDKAHRATRYVALLALARVFPCKAGK